MRKPNDKWLEIHVKACKMYQKKKKKKKKKKEKTKKLEMCPQYMDAPVLGISMKLCKPLPMQGHLCTSDSFLVNKESKNNEKI